MRQENQSDEKNSVAVREKRGTPVYASNPSIPDPDSIKKRRPVRLGNDKKGFVIGDSGEVLGQGAAVFYEFEEVDDSRFVKLYLGAFKKAANLSKAGLAVFELVYRQVQNKPNSDEVQLSFDLVEHSGSKLTRPTYFRGLKELLDNEFLYKSLIDGVYFFNVRYLFNGDRLTFAKGYMRKRAIVKPDNQLDLFVAAPDALEAPEGGE